MPIFNSRNDLSIIMVADVKDNVNSLVTDAQKSGALLGLEIKSRGMVKQSSRFSFSSLSLSPAIENVTIVCEKNKEDAVTQQAIHSCGIHEGAVGAVLKLPVKRIWTTSLKLREVEQDRPSVTVKEPQSLEANLHLITCICQRGKAEKIASAAIREGSASPIINFGEGKGVRDRMGMFKIAVNPEKEIINVVTDELEGQRTFDAMVEAGKLYTPGMGFIYYTQVPSGVVNLHTSISASHSEATPEQIIKAIDELKGSKRWRIAQAGIISESHVDRKDLKDLTNLRLVVSRGHGDAMIYSAMHNGAQGATRSYANLLGAEKIYSNSGREINDEKEVIDFHVGPDNVDTLIKAFEETAADIDLNNAMIMEIPVPRALTYLG